MLLVSLLLCVGVGGVLNGVVDFFFFFLFFKHFFNTEGGMGKVK